MLFFSEEIKVGNQSTAEIESCDTIVISSTNLTAIDQNYSFHGRVLNCSRRLFLSLPSFILGGLLKSKDIGLADYDHPLVGSIIP